MKKKKEGKKRKKISGDAAKFSKLTHGKKKEKKTSPVTPRIKDAMFLPSITKLFRLV
jgi:hypothetical protein